MRITREHLSPQGGRGDYVAKIGVERSGYQDAVGTHTVLLEGFPRLRRNVLGLIKDLLSNMREEDLSLESDTSASDLARRLYRGMPEI